MVTGTEGPDVLTNAPTLGSQTINALGGDDTINVAHPASTFASFATVTVNGGGGVDTVRLSTAYIGLSPTGAFIHGGRIGVFTFMSPAYVAWSEVERLIISGSAYFGQDQNGSYPSGGWSTGDTIDDITVNSTLGGAAITVSSGGGNDSIALGSVGAGSSANGGEGDDLIAFGGTRIVPRLVFAPPDMGWIYYLVANGEDGNDTLLGSSGEDRLNGGAGNDQLRSGLGNDTLRGGTGDDILYFGAAFAGTDLADGGDGRDAIVLQGNYALTFGDTQLVGLESISLQSGANSQFGDTADNLYDFAITTTNGNVAPGQQMIVNGQSLRAGEDFTFDGSAELDGRFLVFGGHGVDTLAGGSGNDLFVFDGDRWGSGDSVDGGGGADSVVITAGTGFHQIVLGDSLTDVKSISVNNHYSSDPSQRPSYEIVLHNGNVAPGGILIVNGSSIPLGQVVNIEGRNVLDGKLILFGGGGHDLICGGAGADLIVGGGGQDSLFGAGGADTYRYDRVSDSPAGGNDLISGFAPGDRVDLSRVDADSLAVGDQAFSWIGSSDFAGTGAASAGELRTFESDGYRWIEADTDGDGGADFAIRFQLGTAPLAQADFVL